MLAALAWYCYLLVVLAALQRYTRFLTELNIFTLFLGFLALRHGLTVPFDDEVNQWFAGIRVTPEAISRYHAALYLMWISILGGIVVGQTMLGHARTAPVPRASPASPLPSGMNKLFVPALLVSVVVLLVYQVRLDASFWRFITGRLSPEEFKEMRATLGISTHYSINFIYHISSIIRFGILPLFIYTLYFMRDRGRAWRVLFWIAFGLGIFLGVSSGQKTPAIFLLIGMGIAIYYHRGRVGINVASLRLWMAVAVALFAVLPLLYKLQYSNMDYEWRLRATFYRISSEYDRCLQLYYEIYPRIEPFLHGRSSPLVDSLLGIPMSDDRIPERFIPIFYLGPSYHDTWNAAFIGVAWADFGYGGVVAESVLVGVILYFFYYWFARTRRTALVMGLQVSSIMAASKLSEVTLTSDLLSFGLLSSAIGYLIMRRAPGEGR